MPDIIMHVNYFEAGYPLATLFDKAKFYGYQGVELRGFRADTTTPDYLKEVKAEWDRTGLPHVILACPAELNNPSTEARAASVDKCCDLLRQAAGIGVKLFNCFTGSLLAEGAAYTDFDKNGSAAATEDTWQWAVEAYQQIGSVAGEVGLKMGFETHNCYLHDLAAPARQLVDLIDRPAVGLNLDMGNIVINPKGEPMEEVIRILSDKIHYVHLKNLYRPALVGGWIVCGLADGVIDNRTQLRLLREVGYAGPLCLEAPRQGDRDFFARSDIEYIRWVLNGLGWQ
jgi:sugar phosphate isomerase/epimerase